MVLTKNGLGYILGDFLVNFAGHPDDGASTALQNKTKEQNTRVQQKQRQQHCVSFGV
jgi:hypothetical protein